MPDTSHSNRGKTRVVVYINPPEKPSIAPAHKQREASRVTALIKSDELNTARSASAAFMYAKYGYVFF